MWDPPFVYAHDRNGTAAGLDLHFVNFFSYAANCSLHVLPVNKVATNLRYPYGDNQVFTMRNRRAAGEPRPVQTLAHGGADLVVGGVYPTVDRARFFAISDGYIDDTIQCYVVPEHRIPRWKYPYAVLQPKVWLCLVMAMVALVAVLSLGNEQGVMANAMTVLGVLTEGSWASRSSQSRQCSALIVLWVVFTMHFNSGYRAVLSTANVGRLVTRGFSSLEEVKESAARVLKLSAILANQVEEILGPVEICGNLDNCSRIVRMNQDSSAMVVSSRNMWFMSPEYFLDERQRPLVKPLPETLYTFYMGALLERDSPLLPVVNHVVAAIRGGGFYRAWLSRMDAMVQRQVVRINRRHSKWPPRLDLARTMGPFALLVTGLAASTCVFVTELLWPSCAVHNRQRQVRKTAGSSKYDITLEESPVKSDRSEMGDQNTMA
ncbi:uncharacterized protein LOC117643704 [Thrips palmi]|uniref:Uncharacterized protein LOC117643704 n=1 Tax=Thrips palmi TaxID=161013 RepID=A0A6P8YWT0_THRPL|nr:uncharacterized protein LOC117643704 [Thrips palmi]